MARHYTFSREVEVLGKKETFTAVEFDSFDEAVRAVDKGINDRKLETSAKTTPAKEENVKKETKN